MTWKRGQSGNPAGRKPGTPVQYRRLLVDKAESLVAKMIDLAESGDVQALRWCCDRLVGPMKAVSPPVTVTLPDGAPLSEQGRAVLLELAKGNLSADECSALLGALQNQSRLIELTEALPLLAELERMVKGNQ